MVWPDAVDINLSRSRRVGMRCSDLKDILKAVHAIKICMEQAWAKGLGKKKSRMNKECFVCLFNLCKLSEW